MNFLLKNDNLKKGIFVKKEKKKIIGYFRKIY